MMIKSMTRKTVSFGQLLDYFSAPEKTGSALLHNLLNRQDDLAAIRREFNSNAQLLPPRKNGNVLYHEILSFGGGDKPALTRTVQEDLTRRYLDLRAPYALAYAKAHYNTDCPHVHLLISANNIGAKQRLRLSKQRFRQIQREPRAISEGALSVSHQLPGPRPEATPLTTSGSKPQGVQTRAGTLPATWAKR